MRSLFKVSLTASLAALALFATILVAGCGNQTDEANKLVEEVNSISASVEPKFTEVEALLTQASTQMSAGQVQAEQTTLVQAQQLLDEIIPEIKTAKDKTDQAAALDISDSYRQYLQAKSRSLDASITITQTSRQLTDVFLADLGLERPETLTQITDLEKTINDQVTMLNEAEAEASKIAAEHADEIKE
jgi:hypothetical protein